MEHEQRVALKDLRFAFPHNVADSAMFLGRIMHGEGGNRVKTAPHAGCQCPASPLQIPSNVRFTSIYANTSSGVAVWEVDSVDCGFASVFASVLFVGVLSISPI